MAYVDGFVVPVPKKKLKSYLSMAKTAGKVWRDHGALEFREWVADDVKVGKRTSFPRSVKLKPGDAFGFIIFASRGSFMTLALTMPFDGRRMIFGGFKTLIDT